MPVPNTKNRKDLDEKLKQYNVVVRDIINIHTSEMIVGAVKRGLGVGYILKDVVKDELKYGDLELLDIKEELPKTKICLAYDVKNLSETPKYFIENYLNIQL